MLNHPPFGAAASTARATAANASVAVTFIAPILMRAIGNTLHCPGPLPPHH